ncbi:MAG TPA: AbrB/MazE/SpoVT family DNA-binding domain-containing protein [Thermoanaerobaculia bacterium]|nr:AbrB/MazE/SpoVT family DNA-binding domain-containing protein [Thermoanaerobaculia bacterium]
MSEPTRVGKRGTIVLPARLRKRYGFEEGTMVVAEEAEYGVLLRPAAVLPVEIYSPERKAELLLSNAVDATDRKAAEVEVRKLGVDPAKLRSRRPSKR